MSRPTDLDTRRPAAVQLHEPDDGELAELDPVDADEPDTSTLVSSYVTDDAISALLGGVERSGEWRAADRLRVRSLFGEVKLDFRRAELPPDGVVEIDCFVLCGQLDITVPEGSEIEMEGVRAIVADLKHRSLRPRSRRSRERKTTVADTRPAEAQRGQGDEAPLFVLSGRAIFGAIHVISR